MNPANPMWPAGWFPPLYPPLSPTDPPTVTPKNFIPPPANADPWHGGCPHLEAHDFEQLIHEGFILHNNNLGPPLDFLTGGPTYDTMLHNYRSQGTPDDLSPNDPIHPCFRWQNWRNPAGNALSIPNYYVLRPVLLLASHILTEPGVLSFFHGLWQRPQKELRVSDSVSAKFGHQTLYWFDAAKFDDNVLKHMEYVWNVLLSLSNYITFEFIDGLMPNFMAHTLMQTSMPGISNDQHTSPSKIQVASEYLHVLRLQTPASAFFNRFQQPYNPAMIDHAARIRTYFQMAVVLVHELAHAFTIATWQRPLVLYNGLYAAEPFFRDQRASEVGNALESFAFDGRYHPTGMGNALHPACPFGLMLEETPGIGNHREQLGSAFKHGVYKMAAYMVPLSFTEEFFKSEWWNTAVARYGHYAFHLPSDMRTRYVTQSSQALPGESPTMPGKWFPRLPTREEHYQKIDYEAAIAGLQAVVPAVITAAPAPSPAQAPANAPAPAPAYTYPTPAPAQQRPPPGHAPATTRGYVPPYSQNMAPLNLPPNPS
ncbi:hypothetical protein MBLNU459_g0757t1 [Dothideomycetes sp. NU459]